MTCIAAVAQDGKVYMAADSAGVAGLSLNQRKDPKIFRVGDMLIGFTSSYRMGQLLGYNLTLPKHSSDDSTERYMTTTFVDAVRATLKTGGYARAKDGEEEAGTFLVGYRGRIFMMDSDYQVGENLLPYAAVGCGDHLALGALHATIDGDPTRRLVAAMCAAETFSAGVRAPFLYMELEAQP